MPTTTASRTISVSREMFARYGIPQQLVSDSGPQFIAEEFSMFLRFNGEKHIKVPSIIQQRTVLLKGWYRL